MEHEPPFEESRPVFHDPPFPASSYSPPSPPPTPFHRLPPPPPPPPALNAGHEWARSSHLGRLLPWPAAEWRPSACMPSTAPTIRGRRRPGQHRARRPLA